jgi:hypothetical protein
LIVFGGKKGLKDASNVLRGNSNTTVSDVLRCWRGLWARHSLDRLAVIPTDGSHSINVRPTRHGYGLRFAIVIRARYSRWVLWFACLLVLVANVFNMGADLGGMADVMQMITGVRAYYLTPFSLLSFWDTCSGLPIAQWHESSNG